MDNKLINTVNQVLSDMGFNLVKLSMPSNETKTVEIMIERLDNSPVSINDCSMVTKRINTLLQIDGYAKNSFLLSVSSAGAERPLLKIEDFQRFISREASIKLKQPIDNNFKINGEILKVIHNQVFIKTKDNIIPIDFEKIKNANLVFTEAMFKKLLNKNK